MRRRLILASPLTALPLPALAQAGWPLARPVRIILPSPPGTPQDFYVRSLCDHYMRAFGGTFLVENRAGASGTIGLAAVANAPPDGYTLAFNSNTAQTISPLVLKDAGFDPLKSFTPVILFYKYGMFLLITASIPARNTREFLTWARAKRPSVNMASVGLGSGGMLMGERVKLRGGFWSRSAISICPPAVPRSKCRSIQPGAPARILPSPSIARGKRAMASPPARSAWCGCNWTRHRGRWR